PSIPVVKPAQISPPRPTGLKSVTAATISSSASVTAGTRVSVGPALISNASRPILHSSMKSSVSKSQHQHHQEAKPTGTGTEGTASLSRSRSTEQIRHLLQQQQPQPGVHQRTVSAGAEVVVRSRKA
ncbi:hypothetical protein HK102_011082, partial [Quaeritorhiza haematococci]